VLNIYKYIYIEERGVPKYIFVELKSGYYLKEPTILKKNHGFFNAQFKTRNLASTESDESDNGK